MSGPLPERVTNEIVQEAPATRLLLDKAFVGIMKGATPSVMNLEKFDGSNAAPVTVTQFTNGQEGQRIHILGDGQMTITHGASVKTSTGANKLLAANKVYNFTYIAGVWYEDADDDSGGAGVVSSVFGRTGAVIAVEGDYSLTLLSDVTITAPADGHMIIRRAGVFINDILLAADIPALDTSKITTGTFANARIAASNVTQHQAALSIATSQLTGTLAPSSITGWPANAAGALTNNGAGVLSWVVPTTGTVTGTGTTGKVPKWSSATALTDSVLSESGGNITIAGSFLPGTDNAFICGFDPGATWNAVYATALIQCRGQILSVSADGTHTVRTLANNTSCSFGASSVHDLEIQAGGASKWTLKVAGHLIPIADNTYDVGVTATNRIRDAYVGGQVKLEGTAPAIRITTTVANAAVAVTLGSTGPTGSTAGAPRGWWPVSIAGTTRYIPFW